MITEDYVSFENAKLLKEKGFNEPCWNYYYKSNYKSKLDHYFRTVKNNEWTADRISAPTLQMAMKWLREVHNIALNVCYLLGTWAYIIYRTDVSSSRFNSEDFDTYEEACEAGIKHCLENLV